MNASTALSLLAAGFMAISPWHLSGQACQGVAGTWTDSYAYTWSLSQSGTTITGSLDPHEVCGDDSHFIWSITGTVDSSGNISLTATPPYVCDLYGEGVEWIRWTFSNATPGCNSSNRATVTNSIGYYAQDWSWSKPCDKPDSESASNFTGWGDSFYDDPTVAWWRARLNSNNGLLFGGRTVAERDGGGGVDGCYFDGSIYGPNRTVPNTAGTVAWDQTYGDKVGPSTTLTNYYRQQRPARGLSMPCSWRYNQQMVIACTPSVSMQFSTNELVPGIGMTTVTSCRQTTATQNCVTRTWP